MHALSGARALAGDAGADMENGIYEGASNQASVPSLKPSDFIAGFVKGKPGNHYRFARPQ